MFDWRLLASGGLDVLGLALVLAGWSWGWARRGTRSCMLTALGPGLICTGFGLGSLEIWTQLLWALLGVAWLVLALIEERKRSRIIKSNTRI